VAPLTSPYSVEHSAQCPPVDPRNKTELECRRCDWTRKHGPYWNYGEQCVTCGTCGGDAPTSDDPRFAGYAGYHSGRNRYAGCSGEYLAHGRPTAERTTEPGWVPLAHVRPGDIICPRNEHTGKWHEPTMVVDIEEGEVAPGAPRIFARWLSDNPHHGSGVWGMWAAPGTPVLLVQAEAGEPRAVHVRVHYSNAHNSRNEVYARCYRTQEAAEADDFWPYNNTRSSESRCWCRSNPLR
jgi:hypothetical protein